MRGERQAPSPTRRRAMARAGDTSCPGAALRMLKVHSGAVMFDPKSHQYAVAVGKDDLLVSSITASSWAPGRKLQPSRLLPKAGGIPVDTLHTRRGEMVHLSIRNLLHQPATSHDGGGPTAAPAPAPTATLTEAAVTTAGGRGNGLSHDGTGHVMASLRKELASEIGTHVPELRMFDHSQGLAGTADFVGLSPDGTALVILEVKSRMAGSSSLDELPAADERKFWQQVNVYAHLAHRISGLGLQSIRCRLLVVEGVYKEAAEARATHHLRGQDMLCASSMKTAQWTTR